MNSFIEPCNEECAFCFLNYTEALIQNPLFHGVDKQILGTIIKGIHHQVKQLEAENKELKEQLKQLNQNYLNCNKFTRRDQARGNN